MTMAVPAQDAPRWPGHPAGIIPATQRPHSAKQKVVSEGRRHHNRQNSLRRAKNSTEQLRARTRGGSNSSTAWSAADERAPSRSGGGRFAVGNVGSNGIIYLRPIARTGTPRARAPDSFIFPPITPPDSLTLPRRPSNGWNDSFLSGSHTPTPAPTSAPAVETERKKPSKHVRSHSFSTIDDHARSKSIDSNTFKVVIDRPKNKRPNTADTSTFPALDVPIPHYRLGSPQFNARGSAILRSSVYTRASGTEDFRSSFISRAPEYDKLFPAPPGMVQHRSYYSRRYSDTSTAQFYHRSITMGEESTQPSSALLSPRISTLPVGPQIYDALTTKPDDPSVVRYGPSGEITAATPARLIAHITSPSFLDYELLSDFFLTFRSYLSSGDLVAYMIARLRWAVERADDFGRIVRVRTFVALRHWILNYFTEDFVPGQKLRVLFCQLVNNLYEDLKNREDGGGGDLKIIGELKKCWRRTCALYWDEMELIGRDVPDDDILPGGSPDTEGPLDGVALEIPPTARPREPVTPPRKPRLSGLHINTGAVSPDKAADWLRNVRHAPQQSITSVSGDNHESAVPLSPASEMSMHVLSCSIPIKSLHRNEPSSGMPLYPHPIPVQRSSVAPAFPVSSRRRRPSQSHKRSGSFSDALRDHRAHSSMSSRRPRDSGTRITVQFPGSLVRGAMFQPDSPYVNLNKPTSQLRPMKSHFELTADPSTTPPATAKSGYTNPGVKRILGSVRRALSSRQGYPSSQGQGGQSSLPLGQRDRDSHTTAALASGPQSGGVQKRRYTRSRAQSRVDILAQQVNDSFTEALEAELELERRPSGQSGVTQAQQSLDQAVLELRNDSGVLHTTRPVMERSHSKVTMGSGSIVIFDDTGAPPVPVMSGAIAAAESSEAASPAAGPSSDQIGQSEARQQKVASDAMSRSKEPVSLPPVAIDPDSLPSLTDVAEFPKPPMPRTTSNRPSIIRHSRSMMSGRAASVSYSLRRYASYHSGMTRHRPGYSVDGGTLSEAPTNTSSDMDPFFLDRPTQAPRQLRRRPGGDLRAVDNVHDLEPFQRIRSTGSLSNLSHSVTNSMALSPRSDTVWKVTKFDPPEESESEPRPLLRRSLSLMATHSSQPQLRPSFEVEVARLAALPDDEDDDGGIEAALLKLEGKYERKSPDPSPRQESFFLPIGASVVPQPQEKTDDPAQSPVHRQHRESEINLEDSTGPYPPQDVQGASIYGMSQSSGQYTPKNVVTERSLAESQSSYSSIPLLDRGVSDMAAMTRRRLEQASYDSARPAPLAPEKFRAQQTEPKNVSAESSLEHVEKTDSIRRIPQGATMPSSPKSPKSRDTHKSFLLDADEDFDDISSDLSTSVPETEGGQEHDNHGVRSFFDDEPARLEFGDELVPHPLRHPPTPPTAMDKTTDKTFNNDFERALFQRGLPTPGLTPPLTAPSHGYTKSLPLLEQKGIELSEMRTNPTAKTEQPQKEAPTHIPYILAYDSQTLAEQFTVIEKDALEEIDWKELIELRWKQSSPAIRNWVEYLRTQEPRGVDVVIARFNIMVKWALSEIILTTDLEERVRTIVKFIHIATHARHIRNYATMYQITVALLSTDCTRLTKTWELVPAPERRTLRELENLVQPVKNFHNLRLEMETSDLSEGCIPFIGIYTRDLIYNAQKPATVGEKPENGESLINFERHHTAATIVKNLLRLLEASSHYAFKPDPEVVSKCLWMAALSDEEISERSRKLEN